jgi:glycosyltransferase involved in cell wall biosynthesis
MLILVHSATNSGNVRQDLGKPEYSYYFVLKEYRRMLEEIGIVVEVADPAVEVDRIYFNCLKRGVPCVFLSFSPPNRTPIDLACPTIPVFAWEFDTIPSETFNGKPRNDWGRVLRHLGAAITHSQFAVDAVRRGVDRDFPVLSAPAPVWDRVQALRSIPLQPVANQVTLKVDGMVIDSRETDLSPYNSSALLAAHGSALPLPDTRRLGTTEIVLDGVIYTSILNPGDGRKNWKDLLQAFCMAFRDTADATLVLKLTHHDMSTAIPDMLESMHANSPFACRVLLVNGYLEQDDYEQLLLATSYAVNSSHGEGQCLPLMEYMSCGKPAVSPRHTAMLDYLDADNAFLVESWSQPGAWPQDPRQAFRTLWQRIDFGSLVGAYRESYRVARSDQARYASMSANAIEALRRYCSHEVVAPRLGGFLRARAAAGDGAATTSAG